MRRNIVGLVWLVGIVLTIAVYQIGPDRIVWFGYDGLRQARAAIDGVFASLALNTFELMRALAIGLFPVFVVLALVALRRGLPARSALVAVTLVVLVLIAAPMRHGEAISDARWTAAFLVVLAGSIAMTRRLTAPALPPSGQGWRGQGAAGPAPWQTRGP
jgi:hypothetical protein